LVTAIDASLRFREGTPLVALGLPHGSEAKHEPHRHYTEQAYAKKKATLENRTRTDDAPDFSKEDVVTLDQAPASASWNRAEFEKTVKGLSALFREMPGIDGSKVTLAATHWVTRFVTSEGTSYVRNMSLVTLTVNADAQAADGMPISDFEAIRAKTVEQLPSHDELVKRIRALQSRLERLRPTCWSDTPAPFCLKAMQPASFSWNPWDRR
jgi:hypothetical protein